MQARQSISINFHRLEAERRKREQHEREELEARVKHERMIREIELTKQHRERTGSILIACYEYLARSNASEWQLKQVLAVLLQNCWQGITCTIIYAQSFSGA